jgi:hypothetical protein
LGDAETTIADTMYYLRDCYDTKPRPMDNVDNYMFLSNKYDAVKMGETDRGYFVLDVADVKAGDSKYFKDLHDEIDTAGCKANFLRFLLDRDLTKYNYHEAPITNTKVELQEC